MFGIVTLSAGGLYWSTQRSDAVSLAAQINATRRALDASVDELALQQETVAIWDDAALKLQGKPLDRTWLRDNITLWLPKIFGQDEVIVVDGQNRLIEASAGGIVALASHYRAREPDLRPILRRLRDDPMALNGVHERLPGRPLARGSTVRTTSRTSHSSHLTTIMGRPAAVSAMLIQSSTPHYDRRSGPASILLSIRYLDADFLTVLAARNSIQAPRFSHVGKPGLGEKEITIRSKDGRKVGQFIWRADMPGSAVFNRFSPIVLAALSLIIVLVSWLARGLIKATSRLDAAINDLEASGAEAQHAALHDVLTGLPNRVGFEADVNEALKGICNDRAWVLALDLDRFKQVNDSFGHMAGDILIGQVAERLVKLADPRDTVARLGGDEFAILARRECDEEITAFCAELLNDICQPFHLPVGRAYIGVSIGVAEIAVSSDQAEILRMADIALYEAKAAGRNCFKQFHAKMDAAIKRRADLEIELRSALDGTTGLCVWYQPQFAAKTTRMIGVEALLRWDHCLLGSLSPAEVVKVAEETGLIIALGDWVLAQACRTAVQLALPRIAVNISAIQLRAPDFVEKVVTVTKLIGLELARLELEITEGTLLEDDQLIRATLTKLRGLGVRIALDDFGTGYSSLDYLRRFPVDTLKIDKCFVQNLETDSGSDSIIQAIIMLGRTMGMSVVAEGVETAEQHRQLVLAGCEALQGFLLARPMDETALANFRIGPAQQQCPRLARTILALNPSFAETFGHNAHIPAEQWQPFAAGDPGSDNVEASRRSPA